MLYLTLHHVAKQNISCLIFDFPVLIPVCFYLQEIARFDRVSQCVSVQDFVEKEYVDAFVVGIVEIEVYLVTKGTGLLAISC